MKYIDVSEWQGVIDWEKVKPNIDGAILRAGYGKNHPDQRFTYNISECNRLGIPCGAYWFSYAYNPGMAAQEAGDLLKAVKPYKIELPLAFDFEYDSTKNATNNGATVTMQLVSDMVRAFCDTIEAAGYYVLNYANPDYLDRYLDDNVEMRFGTWLASWPVAKKFDKGKPPRGCAIWQWGTSTVPGIAGAVDTNEAFHDFKTVIINAGLNNLQPAPPGLKEDALKWAQSFRITDNPEIAEAIWRYHNTFHTAEDDRPKGGLTED